MLRVQGITVAISAVTILRGLSLRVDTGDIVGLVGRNGAGKTTTLRSIMGLTHLSSGRIELDGSLLDGMPSYTRARLGIGYLPEDRRLVPALSVYNNLLIPAQASGIADHDERLRRIFDLIPELSEWSARKASTLSGGQQKLVALARAFVNGRKLLLLDEPFEGVQPHCRGDWHKPSGSSNREKKRASQCSSPNPTSSEPPCSRRART